MKKIININFHSRVIPIEETAYDILRRYVESLKNHFAGEEGGDEIVNDIENRFAELFSDRLKKGATCITDADVEEIISSMGRPEDFDQDENTGTNGHTSSRSSSTFAEETASEEPHRLYRSENDKMLGGVCGGIAAYLRIDSSIVRILFAFLTLGFGTGLSRVVGCSSAQIDGYEYPQKTFPRFRSPRYWRRGQRSCSLF